MNRNLKLALLLIGLTITSGCVTAHPTRSGFLTDYSQLRTVDKDKKIRTRIPDGAALANVDSFYIEKVTWLADDLGQPATNPKNAEHIRMALEKSLVDQLAQVRPLVSKPGPRTAIVRSAVTGVHESKPWVNAALLFMAGPLFNGAASAEIEIVSPAGEQIAAESVAYRGKEWEIFGFFNAVQHPEQAMDHAADLLAKDVQAANHGDVTLARRPSSNKQSKASTPKTSPHKTVSHRTVSPTKVAKSPAKESLSDE